MNSASKGRGSVAASMASVASLVAALSCCLPLGTLLVAAGSAGASLFSEGIRAWLLSFSVACLAFAFAQIYVRSRCEFRHRRLRTLLLWFSTTAVVAMMAAPQQVSSILEGRLPWVKPTGALREFQTDE